MKNRAEEELRQAHDELDRRVRERTAELRAANEALRQEIAEREKTQQTLFEQSRVLEAFYRHTKNPLVFLDRELNFVRVNDAYAKACRRDASEFPGHNHFEFYPSEELEGRFRDVVRTRRPYQVFARPFVFPDHRDWGVTYWNLFVSPILDAAGEVDLLVFSLEDVTPRTLAEQRTQVTNTVQTLFTTKTARKEYLDAVVGVLQNWAGCENVGVRVVNDQCQAPYESYVGFDAAFMALENRLSLREHNCVCTRVIAGRPEAQESAFVTPRGSFYCGNTFAFVEQLTPEMRARYRGQCVNYGYASVAVIPVWYRNEPLGAFHLADSRPGMVPLAAVEFLESLAPLIGEAIHRFNVEEALRRTSRYARNLIEASLDPLVTISPTGEITDVNRATELATGFPRSRLIGSDFSDYFTEPDRAREAYQRVLAEGELKDYPLTIRHLSGHTTDVLYNATVYRNEAGEVQGVSAAARDVTKLMQAQEEARIREQQLVQADKMVSLGILVSGVAHEINNPNYFIRSNAEVLKSAWQDAVPILDEYYEVNGDFVLGGLDYSELRERVGPLCQDIVDGSARIQIISGELRDFARQQPADLTENVNVVDTVNSAITLLSDMIRKSTSRFSFTHDQDLPKVRGSYQRLEQVIINLLQNACQALPDMSKGISVAVTSQPSSHSIVITVRDEGVGIPEESLRHVMDPFFTTKRQTGGTGLGLSIAATIVREHGGTIESESRVNEGTTLRVSLPAQGSAPQAAG